MDKGLKTAFYLIFFLNLFGIIFLTVLKFPFKAYLEILGIFNLVLFSGIILGLVFRKRLQKNIVKNSKKLIYVIIGAQILSFILFKTAGIMEGKPLTIKSLIWFFLDLIISVLLARHLIKKLKKQEQTNYNY